MKQLFDAEIMPADALFILCSSHEERCLGSISRWGAWAPKEVLLFHYDDTNPKREINHASMVANIGKRSKINELTFCESSAVSSFRSNGEALAQIVKRFRGKPVVMDISVFTKRHLLMTLNWLDDHGLWDNLYIVYSEPDDYDATAFLPLSFGISRFEQIPGFAGTPDSSRPLHLLILLGYEGERALATFEQLQPIKTSLVVPDPPFREAWRGRTEQFNADLINRLGAPAILPADAIDPDSTVSVLSRTLGPENLRSDHTRIISPLGTKPQTLGVYMYTRAAIDPPALIYSSPLRHNQHFYSHGVGKTWLLKGSS